MRTCSRSAARAGANPTPNRRLARRGSLRGCRIWETPFRKGGTNLAGEGGPDHPVAQSPRWNSQPPPRFTPFTKKFVPWLASRATLQTSPCVAGAEPQPSAERRHLRELLFAQILER